MTGKQAGLAEKTRHTAANKRRHSGDRGEWGRPRSGQRGGGGPQRPREVALTEPPACRLFRLILKPPYEMLLARDLGRLRGGELLAVVKPTGLLKSPTGPCSSCAASASARYTEAHEGVAPAWETCRHVPVGLTLGRPGSRVCPLRAQGTASLAAGLLSIVTPSLSSGCGRVWCSCLAGPSPRPADGAGGLSWRRAGR